MIKAWIEAMRLRTLPVSVAGVISAYAMCFLQTDAFDTRAVILCLIFAVLCQISSNFANEYYDFKSGLDKKGREGPRRGVTEGDITPEAMRNATFLTLAAACCIGLWIASTGGWWLIGAGILIAVAVLAYSTGPYPLSHHALGETAVLFFFGIIPVNLTFYVATGTWSWETAATSAAIGLMGANVLIVNNYRDADDDKNVGKNTLAVKFGRTTAGTVYLINGFVSMLIMTRVWEQIPGWLWIAGVYLLLHLLLWRRLKSRSGAQLNPVLGMTACLMMFFSILLLTASAVSR